MTKPKKKTKMKTVISLLVGLILVPTIANASSYKATSNINLRSGPSTNDGIILKIPINSNVEYLGESGLWYNVKYNSKQGYVSKQNVLKTEDTVIAAEKYITTENLSLKAGILKSSKKLIIIPKGKSVSLISKHGEYYKVQYGSTKGYVSSKYLINSGSQEELGEYSTKFKLSEANRAFNIQRASNAIDNKVVLPGETFSFNSTTGPRSYKTDYKEAKAILNGKFVPSPGGGVCQVSSTLYNALLNSKLKIVERHPHSVPVSYVPFGKDATVSFDTLDLKFKNNYSFPVYIKSSVTGDTITVKIYSNK